MILTQVREDILLQTRRPAESDETEGKNILREETRGEEMSAMATTNRIEHDNSNVDKPMIFQYSFIFCAPAQTQDNASGDYMLANYK